MKKSYVIVFVLVIGIFVALILILSKTKEKEKVMFNCENSIQLTEGVDVVMGFELKKVSDEFYVVQSTNFTLDETFKKYNDVLYNTLKKNIEQSGIITNYDFVKYNIYRQNNGINVEIIYQVTKENNNLVKQLLEIDVMNNSIEDMLKYYKGKGFVCE